jgi:hypothetical protein
VPADRQALMDQHVAHLAATGIDRSAKQVGDRAPPICLRDQHGETFDVATLLAKGPVVVTFYRDGWCPFCNLELKAYQAMETGQTVMKDVLTVDALSTILLLTAIETMYPTMLTAMRPPITSESSIPKIPDDRVNGVYHIDQTGLGFLVASFASGALLGSIAISVASRLIRPARMMLVFAMVWYAMLLVFVRMPTVTGGSAMLALAGFAQSLSMVPMAVMLLQSAGARFRGRVMGVRMFAIYGLPLGLLPAGALIDRIAFAPTVTLYCCIGLAATLVIALRWRADLWPLLAPANQW